MQQSLSERGVKLDGIQEQFNQLGEASQGWYESLTKTAESQKRKYPPRPSPSIYLQLGRYWER